MNFSDFHFIRPFWLLALIPYAVLIFAGWKNRLMQGNWSQVCDQELLPYILQDKPVEHNRWPLLSSALAAFLAIIALAGPSWERLPSPVFRNAAGLVIALDLSRSMDAADITPSRLIRARYKIADILRRRKDGQTALIVYAGDVFTVTPLTEDTETIRSQLSALTTEIMPVQGSNTSLAIERAVELFKQAGLTSGGILLVTDDVVLEDALPVVGSLKSYKLSILGVGTEQGAPIKTPDGGFLKDVVGNMVISKMKPGQLQELAEAGGGIFRAITPDDSDIEALLAVFDSQVEQQAETNNLLLDLWLDRGPWLVLLVVPLAAFNFRRGILSLILVILLQAPETGYAFEWQDFWQTQDQQAQQQFNQQHYKEAAENFANPEWKASAYYKAGEYQKSLETLENLQTSDAYYNKANAFAKMGKLQEALKAYQQALKINPKHEDALYNKKLVEEQLEKQKQQNKQQQSQQSSQKDKQQPQDSEQQNQDQQDQGKTDTQSSKQNQDQQAGQNQKPEDQQQTGEQQDQQEAQPQDQQKKNNSAETENSEKQAEAQQQKEQNTADANNTRMPVNQEDSQSEQQQADEQWLQRIPDDPSGLLRRKFLYQYGRRKNRSQNSEAW